MVYEVPASKRSIKQNRYEFKIAGKKYDIPKLQYLDGNMVDMLAQAEERGGIFETAANYALFGPADSPAGKAVRTLDAEQLADLIADYQEQSKVRVGESSASTDS